jgi:2-methylcitrate dehydratase
MNNKTRNLLGERPLPQFEMDPQLLRRRTRRDEALREQFEEYRAPGRCTLIGGSKTSADQAALFNSGLVRYVDLLDSYMALGGLCHPSDNFGTVLAAAEQAGASGGEFMLALAVAYEIQCSFQPQSR